MKFNQRILRGDEVIVEASVRVACLDAASFQTETIACADRYCSGQSPGRSWPSGAHLI